MVSINVKTTVNPKYNKCWLNGIAEKTWEMLGNSND